ncbi:ABC transporter ATP-binding protein [Tamlana crocina]
MSNTASEKSENEVLVKVEGLSKKFCKDLKTSLWYGVKDLVSGMSGNKNERDLRPKEFWAVKDVSFELRRGECLGLIGHNGAGKSTLLKILNGLINPDAGKVTIKGRVGALIELGAGFNPILSGRENIYNNGAVLGFSRKEITEKLDDIITFAELEEFIDMPVQNYSSGMKVRLGFAVAAQMEPDVLIIDEVLAVGDAGFKIKCYNKISEMSTKCAMIFVSHSMPQIARICTDCILMKRGVSMCFPGDVGKAIEAYDGSFSNGDQINTISDYFKVLKIEVNGEATLNRRKQIPISFGNELTVFFELSFLKEYDYENFIITLVVTDKSQRAIAIAENEFISKQNFKKEVFSFTARFDEMNLTGSIYSLTLNVVEKKSNGMRNVLGRVLYFAELLMQGKKQESYAPIVLNSTWQ